MSDEQINTIYAAAVAITLLLCLTKCSIEQDRLHFEKERANLTSKP